MKILVASSNLVGDTVCQTPGLKQFKLRHPEHDITWLLADSFNNRVLSQNAVELGICDRVVFDHRQSVEYMGYSGFDWKLEMNIDRMIHFSYPPGAPARHMTQGFALLFGTHLGIQHARPVVEIPISIRAELEFDVSNKRYLVVAPNSYSGTVTHRGPSDGLQSSKSVSWSTWMSIINELRDRNLIDDARFLLGPEVQNVPPEAQPLVIRPQSIFHAVAYAQAATSNGGLFAGVDTGIMHMAVGAGVPSFCVYPHWVDPLFAGYLHVEGYSMAQVNCMSEDPDLGNIVLRKWKLID